MKRALAALLAAAILIAALYVHNAQAFSLGGEGKTFGKLGRVVMKKGAGAGPVTPCTSTGIFDLSNTCNNIYLLTGSL